MSNPRSQDTNTNFNQVTRRRVLKVFGAGAAAVALGGKMRSTFAAATAAPVAVPTAAPVANGKFAVADKAQPFDLADVRLLDGPFKGAQQRDAKYLLSLEPDRMLHNFRTNAGLQAKAPVYGGWESVQTWADIRCHGHTLGHYLTALALMYASTGDAAFKQRLDYCLAELQACQNAGKTGLICAFPDNATQFDNMTAGRRIVGVPWYTMHKIFAGLRDAYLFANSPAALQVLVKLADWAVTLTQPWSDDQFQRILGAEHGGMNEVLADVYVITGDEKYLKLAQRFCHLTILTPLSEGRDTLNGLHSNTQIPKVVGFQRLYMLTGEKRYLDAAEFFWHNVVETRSYTTGGHGDQEHFFPVTEFNRRLTSAKTMETCCTHNMLRLTRALFLAQPAGELADFYERALFNAILGSQDPDSGMFTYFQATRPGYVKLFCTPTDSFWCCTGTGMENHAKYGDSIYFKSADALYVNLFIASTVQWKEKGLSLRQDTRFPEEGKTRLEITAAAPVNATVKIRYPAWSDGQTIKVNGTPVAPTKPGSFNDITRAWKTGDVVEIECTMKLRLEILPGTPDRVAFAYGPIVLVGALGKEGLTPGSDIIVNERQSGTMLNQQIEVPTLAADPAAILDKIQPVPDAGPLTFRTTGIGRPKDITLVPYYRLAHERYNLYWQLEKP
jgi:uncharacterized protein